jgi:hypothetical protein
MKVCPLCDSAYAADLNYCLKDGAVLLPHRDDELTRVSPQPIPRPPLPPTPVQPTPASSRGPVWTVLGVLGTILVVLFWGGIKLALWSAEREDHTAQSNNSGPSSFDASASPSPNCATSPFGCYSPTPTPTLTPRPSPSPSPLPSPTVAEPTERLLSAGTYECEQTIKSDDGRAALLKVQFTFNPDGTYLEQGYVTFHGTDITDLLGIEERGSASQANDQLAMWDRLERKLNLETRSWGSWNVPRGGSSIRQRIRNVTPTTFQMYDNDEKAWFTFSRL